MHIQKWRKLASKYIHKSPWATLRIDTCELPNGIIKDDYYVLEYSNWVNAIAVTQNNALILVRQYRHGADVICLEIPGGVIDSGEDPEIAIKRELLEETGYSFDSCEKLVELYPNPATSTNKTYTYLLKGGIKIQDQKLDESEFLKVEIYTIAEIKELLKNKKISQALHVAALHYGLVALEEKI